jgi:hypothetical protein
MPYTGGIVSPAPVKPPVDDILFESFISPNPSIPEGALKPLISPIPSKPLTIGGLPLPEGNLFDVNVIGMIMNELKKVDSPAANYAEQLIGDFPAVVYEELEKHVKPIDPELYMYMVNAAKTLSNLRVVLRAMISVGSYPYRKKIEEMKYAFASGGEVLSRISSFLDVKREFQGCPGSRCVREVSFDPADPDASPLPPELVKKEEERRQYWAKEWLIYVNDLRKKLIANLGKDLNINFSCDLPFASTPLKVIEFKISPRLRLPSGEYLEPVTVSSTISPVAPITPQPVQPSSVAPVTSQPQLLQPVAEEKKSFPWWFVAVIGVVGLFFIMKKK